MKHQQEHGESKMNHYPRLLAMTAVSFAAMYALMYAMVASADDVYHNVNQVYMAGLMAAPMLLIELALMWGMYPNKRVNLALASLAAVVALSCFLAIRRQAVVADRQFLRSMIPHHSAAVLMCEQASISDPEIKTLCGNIVSSQTSEIRQMRAILQRKGVGQ